MGYASQNCKPDVIDVAAHTRIRELEETVRRLREAIETAIECTDEADAIRVLREALK